MPAILEYDPMTYMGIDPGNNGGMAVLDADGHLLAVTKMPDTPSDALRWIREQSNNCVAVLEQVGGYVGKGQPGSAMFNFGRGFGNLEMALLACEVPFDLVQPRKWQKAMGVPVRKKNESKVHWKNRLKAVAQRLFPSENVTLAVADALLIAEYCRRLHRGMI